MLAEEPHLIFAMFLLLDLKQKYMKDRVELSSKQTKRNRQNKTQAVMQVKYITNKNMHGLAHIIALIFVSKLFFCVLNNRFVCNF